MPSFRILAVLLTVCAGFLTPGAARGQAGATLHPLPLDDLGAFRSPGANWSIAGDVAADRSAEGALTVQPGTGVLVNRPTEAARENLFTEWEHGDLALVLDVMLPKGSNSGIYLQGRYEVQLFDSWGVAHPRSSDMGGIYERWDETRPEGRFGYGGIPPRLNAAKAPGLWQRLEIDFRAPRFDASGRKVENARFVRVALNGVVLHENVEVTGPTRAAAFEDERAAGPLMIQGDHGPVAFRDISYKRYGLDRVTAEEVRYRAYARRFGALPELAALTPDAEGALDGLRHDVYPNWDTFAVAFDGMLKVPTAGSYDFVVDLGWIDNDPHLQGNVSGGALLTIGDEAVVAHDGRQQQVRGAVDLTEGRHPFRLVYFKSHWGPPVARLLTEGPDTRLHVLNVPETLPTPRLVAPIDAEPGRAPYVLRGMVYHGDEKRTHAATVGDPAGVHYALDLGRGALLHLWRGPFVDATAMWGGRGYEQVARPLGAAVAMDGEVAVAALPDRQAPWPAGVPADYRFQGYELDEEGRPIFRYSVADLGVAERFAPLEGARGLRRTLSLRGAGAGTVWHRVARGSRIERLADGSYAVGDRAFYVQIEEAGGLEPVVRTAGGAQELLLPVRLDGGAGRVQVAYLW